MIPTWNPIKEHLKQSLQSVLMQDQGEKEMQIAVVDDASTDIDVESVVRDLDVHNRVEFYRNEQNLGIGGNWNRCVDLAKGEWIHLMHQDDWLRDGFYEQIREGLSFSSSVGMAYVRTIFADMDGDWQSFSKLVKKQSGIINDYRGNVHNTGCFPSSNVIKRKVFNTVGKYNESLVYSLDKEMTIRISAQYDIWYGKSPLHIFRINEKSQTARLNNDGTEKIDYLKMVNIVKDYLPPDVFKKMNHGVYSDICDTALSNKKFQLLKLVPLKLVVKRGVKFYLNKLIN